MKRQSIISNPIRFDKPIKPGDSVFTNVEILLNEVTGKQELKCEVFDLNGKKLGGSLTIVNWR